MLGTVLGSRGQSLASWRLDIRQLISSYSIKDATGAVKDTHMVLRG